MTLEDYLPQIQLLTLQNYNNTIIAYAAYVRFGKKAIADYCREKIGKEVRVIVKDDDPINEDGSKNCFKESPASCWQKIIRGSPWSAAPTATGKISWPAPATRTLLK